MVTVVNVSEEKNKIIMEMKDGEAKLGQAVAEIKEGKAVMLLVECEVDLFLLDLAKALLNAIDLSGVEEVSCYEEKLFALAKKLRFIPKEDGWYLNLNGYFSLKC